MCIILPLEEIGMNEKPFIHIQLQAFGSSIKLLDNVRYC